MKRRSRKEGISKTEEWNEAEDEDGNLKKKLEIEKGMEKKKIDSSREHDNEDEYDNDNAIYNNGALSRRRMNGSAFVRLCERVFVASRTG